MDKGIVILRPPAATLELRGQIRQGLEGLSYQCESRERFDGVLVVAFERGEGEAHTPESLREFLRTNPLLAESDFEVRAQG